MSSTLVFGGSKNQRKNTLNGLLGNLGMSLTVQTPDLLYITKLPDKKSIGLEQVRNLKLFANERPMSKGNKGIVIEDAHLLTVQAQNSLLKTLEEHPGFCHFLLGAKNEASLLETVVSRCKKVNLSSLTQKSNTNTKHLLELNIGERLAWAVKESENEREEVIEHLEVMILELYQEMLKNQSLLSTTKIKLTNSIELLAKIKRDLENTNVTLKLALEYIAAKL